MGLSLSRTTLDFSSTMVVYITIVLGGFKQEIDTIVLGLVQADFVVGISLFLKSVHCKAREIIMNTRTNNWRG